MLAVSIHQACIWSGLQNLIRRANVAKSTVGMKICKAVAVRSLPCCWSSGEGLLPLQPCRGSDCRERNRVQCFVLQGNVYVKCPSIAAATAAVSALHGRWFAGEEMHLCGRNVHLFMDGGTGQKLTGVCFALLFR